MCKHCYPSSYRNILGFFFFFFLYQVAIEAMVVRARELDPYLKPLLAPLGIFFPFPFLCKLLDSYLKKDSEITAAMNQYNLTGNVCACVCACVCM